MTQTRTHGTIIAFPDKALRPQRFAAPNDEPKGKILLFTGVRYERPTAHPGPSKPFASNGSSRRRRRS